MSKKDFRLTLCKKIKKYDTVIVYGYEDIGLCVLDYIIDFETSIKIANYSGRVKFFATSKKLYQGKREEKKGIPIRSIYSLQEYAKEALVIVATQEKHHKTIDAILDNLKFKHVLHITHEAYCELRECVENHKYIVDTRLMQCHLNHQVKLNRLREKVGKGKVIKVCFMSHDTRTFGCSSIYREMEKDTLFDPFILVTSRRDINSKNFYDEVLKDVEFFRERGYKVIKGYDENGNPIDLHGLLIDILFYDLPKMYGAGGKSFFRLDLINWEYLTCYVPYGLMMINSFFYHYHTMCIRETWKFFLDTNANFQEVLADSEFNAYNSVLSGYPKFDEYFIDNEEKLPEKLRNSNRTIIYAPHHSMMTSNNLSTFDLYKDIILEIVRNNPDINFVFKPHPLLSYAVNAGYKAQRINFSLQDYQQYISEWENMPNGVCVMEGDYIEIFKRSDCMITDCGSFIGEYLPSLNPCIYLFNPRHPKQGDMYTKLAKKILDTYYIAENREEMIQYISNIGIRGNDEKRGEREKLLKEEFASIGKSGNYIYKYIREQVV